MKLQAIRGMNDILPSESYYWQFLETVCRKLAYQYGYQEIRTPYLEPTALFARSIGEHTDIVEKEMYTFLDRNGDSLSLRPEGTAGCVRAGIEHHLLEQTQKLWYLGPMFRHERPQKGRYRQFHQFGVEVWGYQHPVIDFELILMTSRLWKLLGLQDQVELQLNTLGTRQSRWAYRQYLVDYFTKQKDLLDEESLRRLESNPLRILDSKNKHLEELIKAAPKITDCLDEPSKIYFTSLRNMLDQAKIPYVLNPKLVRGLDYYSMTVFEWVTHDLGAQGTVCAGGRYDDLFLELGTESVGAIGFACGLERILLLLKQKQELIYAPDVYAMIADETIAVYALQSIEKIKDRLPNIKIETDLSFGKFKNQFRKADKSKALWGLIFGEQEMQTHTFTLKNLQNQTQHPTLNLESLCHLLTVKDAFYA